MDLPQISSGKSLYRSRTRYQSVMPLASRILASLVRAVPQLAIDPRPRRLNRHAGYKQAPATSMSFWLRPAIPATSSSWDPAPRICLLQGEHVEGCSAARRCGRHATATEIRDRRERECRFGFNASGNLKRNRTARNSAP